MRRAVHQPRAVGRQQMRFDQLRMVQRLVLRENAGDDPADHRQQPVLHPRFAIERMQQRPVIVGLFANHDQPRRLAVQHKALVEILRDRLGGLPELLRLGTITRMLERVGIPLQGLEKQLDGPSADHRLAQLRPGRLQRVIPVAVAVGQQRCAGHEPTDQLLDGQVEVFADRVRFLREIKRRIGRGVRRQLIEQ